MNDADDLEASTAALAAALFAVDPAGLGGVVLRGAAGAARDAWLATLRALAPHLHIRRVPLAISDARLLGGLDLTATLRAGKPIAERGVLAAADGGVIMLAMAERLTQAAAARLARVLDTGEVALQRDGLALRQPARLGVIALDEGIADDERMPEALRDRLALHLDVEALPQGAGALYAPQEIDAARALLPLVQADEEIIATFCMTAAALGVASLRAPMLALQAARIAAALDGRSHVSREDATLAAQLVLAPRATMLPASREDDAPPEAEEPNDSDDAPDDSAADPVETKPLDDVVLAAALAALPADLLARLTAGRSVAKRAAAQGKAGALVKAVNRGRPVGVRAGALRAGSRLNLLETLRAAAPWQKLRRAHGGASQRIAIRPEDFRITRFKQRAGTVTVFAVDASGSSALNRLAEAKGAVELLLADCYIRRDRVAVVAFRGKGAELLLAPTRSLTRARRSLAGLPGGGATPVAAGIDVALGVAAEVKRRGETPVIVLLTDGAANITREGKAGRPQAAAEAQASARQVAAARIAAVLIDTSPKPQPPARAIADAMHALYLPLPYASAHAVSQAVKATALSR